MHPIMSGEIARIRHEERLRAAEAARRRRVTRPRLRSRVRFGMALERVGVRLVRAGRSVARQQGANPAVTLRACR